MPTKAPKETKTSTETKAAKETKAPKAAKASKGNVLQGSSEGLFHLKREDGGSQGKSFLET
jgi:hypothetical protein